MARLQVTDDMLTDPDGKAKRDKYTCPYCQGLLVNAVQPSCGHWMCKSCADQLFETATESGSTPKCLKIDCGEELIPEPEGTNYFPDHFVRKDILKMKIRCRNINKGCEWIGKLGDLKVHLDTCEYTKTECEFCGEQLFEGQEESHKRVCSKALRNCPLSHLGCPIKDKMTRTEVEQHVSSSLLHHFDIVASAIDVLKDKNSHEHPQQRFSNEEHYEDLGYHSLLPGAVEADGPVRRKAKISENPKLQLTVGGTSTLGQQLTVPRGYPYGGDFVERDCPTATVPRVGKEKQVLQALHQEVASYTGIQQPVISDAVLQRAVEKVFGEKIDDLMRTMKEMMASETQPLTEDITAVRGMCNKMERTIRAKNAEQEDTNFRISLLENGNHDGTMIWKIPQFSQRMSDAENGRYTSIFSLPFSTGRYGYKMCMRLYILGDGIGKDTHMSLFFVLMKGEFDNILQWPFTHKVTFKLINQAGGRDVVDTFQPDPMSSSFRKPRSDMNIASGCPRFISIYDLKNNGFIVDDTVYIKCTVDMSTIRHP